MVIFIGFIVDVDFNPYVSLMKALVLDLLLTPDRKDSLERKILNKVARIVMTCASYANSDLITRRNQIAILDQLDKVIGRASKAYRHWSNDFLDPYAEYGQLYFLDLAALYNLTEYLLEKFAQKKKSLFNVVATFLLHRILPSQDSPPCLEYISGY